MEINMAVLGLGHQYARSAGMLVQLQQLELKQRAVAEHAAAKQTATVDQVAEVSQKRETIRSDAKAAFCVDLSSVEPRRTIPKDHRSGWGKRHVEMLEPENVTRVEALSLALQELGAAIAIIGPSIEVATL